MQKWRKVLLSYVIFMVLLVGFIFSYLTIDNTKDYLTEKHDAFYYPRVIPLPFFQYFSEVAFTDGNQPGDGLTCNGMKEKRKHGAIIPLAHLNITFLTTTHAYTGPCLD